MPPRDAIRGARPEDAEAILEIYAPIVRDTAISFELEPPTIAAMTQRIATVTQDDPWMVLESDVGLAGYAYATTFRGRDAYDPTRETTVYVHPDHRRRGVGRRLMVALLDELRRNGTHLAIGVIALPNPASVTFHESLGFRPAGRLHQVAWKLGRWHDEGFWELLLESDSS